MLELWEMQSTPLLPSLPGPVWPRVVIPDRILFEITYFLYLTLFKLRTYAKLNCLK